MWAVVDNRRIMYLFKIPLILRHFLFWRRRAILKINKFPEILPSCAALAERWTTTDVEQTCNPRRTGSCPGSERDSRTAGNLPQKHSPAGQSGTAVNLLENR